MEELYARLYIKFILVLAWVMTLKLYVDVSCSLTVWQYVWHWLIREQYIMSHVKQNGLFKTFSLLFLLFQENGLNSLVISYQWKTTYQCVEITGHDYSCVFQNIVKVKQQVKYISVFNGKKWLLVKSKAERKNSELLQTSCQEYRKCESERILAEIRYEF